MYGGSSTGAGALGYGCDATSALSLFPLLPLPQLAIPDEFNSLHEAGKPLVHPDAASYASSSCYDSPSSTSEPARATLMQRSISSHALLNRINGHYDYSPYPYSLSCGDSGPEAGPVRRVYSAGDLQRRMGDGTAVMENGYKRSESPPQPPRSESSPIIEGMSRACRYSPEEKMERIERYRSKRHSRNFNKKIKYACRKTLADSRPRIRGRFARNGGIDQKSTSPLLHDQWNLQVGAEEDEDEDDDWISFIDAFSSGNSIVP